MRLFLFLLISSLAFGTAHSIENDWIQPAPEQYFVMEGYYVYRSIDSGAWTQVASPSVTTWTDNSPKSGHTYCYAVTAKGYLQVPGYPQSGLLESPQTTPSCVSIL